MPLYSGLNQNPPMDNSVPMNDNAGTVPTSHAAVTVDTILQANIDKKTAVRQWDAGSFTSPGTPQSGDMVIITDSISISGGAGNAVFNITNDHTSSGTALCSSIIQNSCVVTFWDTAGLYAQGSPTIAGNLKTVTIPTTKRTDNSIIILTTISVIGSASQTATPNSTVAKFFGIGYLA